MLSRSSRALLVKALKRFHRSTEAVSAVEFAFVAPVLIVMIAGAVELSGAVTAGNRATYVAEDIGQVVSQTQGPISVSDMQGIIKAAALVDPGIIEYAKATGKSLETAVDVTVSSVVFTKTVPACTSNCAYTAGLVFSEALSGTKRVCGALTAASGNDPKTLPAKVFSPSSLVVVDARVFYKPLMTTIFGDEISFRRTSYLRPRYVEHVNYANNCQGYPVT